MKLTKILLYIIGCIVFVNTSAESQPTTSTGSRLASESLSVEVSKKARDERHRVITLARKTVEDILGKPKVDWTLKDSNQLGGAIDLLGDYRAKDAADLLVVNCTVHLLFGVMMDNNILAGYPSIQALVNIGNPSVEAILRRMMSVEHLVDPKPLEPRDLHAFAYIVSQIDGEEVGLFRLELALKEANTEKQKKSFTELVEIYKKKESVFDLKRALTETEK